MARKTIYNPAYRELVTHLRGLREEQGKSQTQLAQELMWPQQRLSAVEAGARRLDIIEFIQLVEAQSHCPSDVILSLLEMHKDR